MIGNWEIYLSDDECFTADGGKIIYVHLHHFVSGVRFVAHVVRHDNEPRFVDTILRDDLQLPPAVLRRLLGKVHDNYATRLTDDCPCGLIASVVLGDFIDDVYTSDAPAIRAVIQSSFDLLLADSPTSSRSLHFSETDMKSSNDGTPKHADDSFWWEIGMRRIAAVDFEEPAFSIVFSLNQPVSRQSLRQAHRDDPTADITDLLQRLMPTRCLAVLLTIDKFGDPNVHAIKADDFGLAYVDAVAISIAIFRHLSETLLHSEIFVKAVIHLEPWLEEFLQHPLADRVYRALHTAVMPLMAAKE